MSEYDLASVKKALFDEIHMKKLLTNPATTETMVKEFLDKKLEKVKDSEDFNFSDK
jgi:hypothetical protein